MAKLSKIWRNISKVTKIRLVNTLIFPITRYASEMWTMKKAEPMQNRRIRDVVL